MAKHRLQLDFDEEAFEELNQLRKRTGLPNRAELIRHALKYLQWTLDETQNNHATLLLEKNGRAREVVFPFWSRGTGRGIGTDREKEERMMQ